MKKKFPEIEPLTPKQRKWAKTLAKEIGVIPPSKQMVKKDDGMHYNVFDLLTRIRMELLAQAERDSNEC